MLFSIVTNLLFIALIMCYFMMQESGFGCLLILLLTFILSYEYFKYLESQRERWLTGDIVDYD